MLGTLCDGGRGISVLVLLALVSVGPPAAGQDSAQPPPAPAAGAPPGPLDVQIEDYLRRHPGLFDEQIKDYLKKHPEGYWQGENSVYMGRKGGDAKGERMFRGFGVNEETETDLKKELAKQFNYPPSDEDKKAGADMSLKDKQIKETEVPGVDLTTLIRPSKKTTELP